jgi:tetratricopeptide (TPR) repeat protein
MVCSEMVPQVFDMARGSCHPLVRGIALACAVVVVTGQAPPVSPIARIEKQAETARQENRVDDAIALYKKGVGIKPSWDEGWWSLGTLNYSLEKYDEARDAFRHLTVSKPEAAIPWGLLGLCEFELKKYDQATEHLRHGAALGLGLGQDKNIEDAVNYHLALLETRSGEYEASMKLIALFAQRNLNDAKYTEAMGIAALRKPLLPSELPPTDRLLVMDVGRVMYDATALRTTEAAAEFKILVDKYPDTPNIHYLYGSFLMFSDANGGLAEMKKELEVSPAHVPALVTIASEYIQRKEYKTGLPYAEKAVELEPQSFPAHAVLGRIFAEGDVDPERGIKELEEARKLAPGSPQVRIALATAYGKVGRKDDAARERQEFLKLRKEADEAAPSQP